MVEYPAPHSLDWDLPLRRYIDDPARRRLMPQTVWAIGDSITSNGVIPSTDGSRADGAAVFGPLSYLGWALLQTGGRFVFGGVAATTGFDTTEIRDTHLPTVVAAAPGACVIGGGTNDTVTNDPDLTFGNIVAMAEALLEVGTLPILATIPPQGTAPVTFVSQMNARIRAYAEATGLPLADWHRQLVQIVTGGFGTAYHAGDQIHPNSLGAKAMGDILAAALIGIPQAPPSPQLLGGFDSNAMMQDPTYNVVTGHWTQSGTGSPVSTSTSPTFAWKGNKVTLVSGGASSNKFLTGTLGDQPVAGERMSMFAKVDASVVPASGTWSAILSNTGSDLICGYSLMDQVLAVGSVMGFDFEVTAGQLSADPLTLNYVVQGVNGVTLGAAESSVLNLSSLGVAA